MVKAIYYEFLKKTIDAAMNGKLLLWAGNYMDRISQAHNLMAMLQRQQDKETFLIITAVTAGSSVERGLA